MTKVTKACKACGKEKKLSEFRYRSSKCKDCDGSSNKTKAYNMRRQQIFNVMREWHKDNCNNDCDNCGFHEYCQKVLDVFEDTNWSEGEG